MGAFEGDKVGDVVGIFVGDAVGIFVGDAVGIFVGRRVGAFVGVSVGASVGGVGTFSEKIRQRRHHLKQQIHVVTIRADSYTSCIIKPINATDTILQDMDEGKFSTVVCVARKYSKGAIIIRSNIYVVTVRADSYNSCAIKPINTIDVVSQEK